MKYNFFAAKMINEQYEKKTKKKQVTFGALHFWIINEFPKNISSFIPPKYQQMSRALFLLYCVYGSSISSMMLAYEVRVQRRDSALS